MGFEENLIKVCKNFCLFYNLIRYGGLLLGKLLAQNPAKRYSVDKILKHPWITRNLSNDIPRTYLETMKVRTLKNKMREVNIKLIYN